MAMASKNENGKTLSLRKQMVIPKVHVATGRRTICTVATLDATLLLDCFYPVSAGNTSKRQFDRNSAVSMLTLQYAAILNESHFRLHYHGGQASEAIN